ncbi:MAG: hypothetical protein ABI640_21955 [Gammaproteobacteria bacterium]
MRTESGTPSMTPNAGGTAMPTQGTVVPAMPGYRVIRVQLADATAPPLFTVAPIVAWLVDVTTGAAEPVTVAVDGLDASSADCAIEGGTPGCISRGIHYDTLMLFIESRRDAIRQRAYEESIL